MLPRDCTKRRSRARLTMALVVVSSAASMLLARPPTAFGTAGDTIGRGASDRPIAQSTGLPHTEIPPTDAPGLPSTVQPSTAMRPTAVPPTAPPATERPSQVPPDPTRTRLPGAGPGVGTRDAPEGERGDGESYVPPPPTATAEGGTVAPPTRTRRPTRTPRTTPTPTPTPMVAGGLRLTLAADPAVLVVGMPVSLRIVVANRMDRPAGNVTLQAVVPADVIVDRHLARLGHIARDGNVVRWFVPMLPAGEETELLLYGVLGISRPGGQTLCVTVLSAGAPVEHCALFQTAVAEEADNVPTIAPTPPLIEDPAVGAESPVNRSTLGLALLLAGLLAAGLLAGDRLRRRG